MTDVRMRGFRQRHALREVEALIEARIRPLDVERVPFSLTLGRVLAEPVVAPRNVPPHPKSAMDGYAVRAADLPGRLEVVGEIMAKASFDRRLEKGEAVRIMTGARVPEGADTVVMVEDTVSEPPYVSMDHASVAGRHVLRTGEDLSAGAVILEPGRRLGPADLSMLVNLDALEVTVRRTPKVRLIPTGNELIPAGQAPSGNEVVESNSYMLSAMIERDGGVAMPHPIVRDDKEMLKEAIRRPGADLVVVTGGSSVGMEDFGPVVVRELGELPIHGLHMKPASPSGVGFVDGVPVLLAPGYPIAGYVAWDMIGRLIVQRQLGRTPALPYAKCSARLARSEKKAEAQVLILRVKLEATEGGLVASSIKGGAALLSTLTGADGFVIMPEGTSELEAGTEVTVYCYPS